MKKTRIRELRKDIKAAVRLGHPESVEMALDGLRSLPQVAANDRLGAGFIEQVILPNAQIMARLPAVRIQQMTKDSLTALRAVGAAALAKRFLVENDVTVGMLRHAALDSRPEVRTAVGQILREAGDAHPERLLGLMGPWLRDSSPKVRCVALGFAPALLPAYGEDVIEQIGPLGRDSHADVRAALVDALQEIAQAGFATSVWGLLADWVTESPLNVWVLTRTVAGAWAASNPRKAQSILGDIYSKIGETKDVGIALRSLKRHGVDIEF
ncbi:MAG: hypothetical protein U9Q82_00950 [Chloroflexota bacterium]|nr:hypothetical protein [Chloroflexota bacterium]